MQKEKTTEENNLKSGKNITKTIAYSDLSTEPRNTIAEFYKKHNDLIGLNFNNLNDNNMKIFWIALSIGAIALIIKTSKGRKGTQSREENKSYPTPTHNDSSPTQRVKSSKSAKTAFLENLDRFKSLLPTLCDGTFNSSDWTDKIIDINNEELIMYWKKAHKSVDAWLRLLASWGLRPEDCASFEAIEIHKKMYVTESGAEIVTGQTYKVIQKCWIQTDSDNQKKVVAQGKAE